MAIELGRFLASTTGAGSPSCSVYDRIVPGDIEHPDALQHHRIRGRGAGINPPNRFDGVRLSVLGEFLDEQAAEYPEGVQVPTTVYEDRTKSVLNRVDSPDLPFRWTVNPYRGCEHGCVYCYARPGHEMLGFSLGLDFETKIAAKTGAPALLAAALDKPAWAGETVVMSGVTDPYQPIERRLRITRACLEVMAARAQPVAIVTKNALVLRDIDLLRELSSHGACRVYVSVTSLDPHTARAMEPRASSPASRLRAIRELTDAGVPTGVMTAPIIPGLNDHEMPALLKAAHEAGARSAGWVLLRLPHQIKDVFFDWARREFPDRAKRIEHAVRETREGELYDAAFFTRQRGTGERAEHMQRTFEVFTRRLGMNKDRVALSTAEFERRRAALRLRGGDTGQRLLFGE
ncbi:MAG: PA0069 family radical SAM protein [Phycisphaerales bacterium]|nr:MAG: PA0069 family radical SAM protein [Phycisphaerales bacterium]